MGASWTGRWVLVALVVGCAGEGCDAESREAVASCRDALARGRVPFDDVTAARVREVCGAPCHGQALLVRDAAPGLKGLLCLGSDGRPGGFLSRADVELALDAADWGVQAAGDVP